MHSRTASAMYRQSRSVGVSSRTYRTAPHFINDHDCHNGTTKKSNCSQASENQRCVSALPDGLLEDDRRVIGNDIDAA